MQTSEQIAEMLCAYGVSHFFFVPVVLPETCKRMSERGILPVMTHGEKAAAYMADGYARISRKVGLCGAQAIGSTNLAAGLRDAYMARAPIVALSGEPNAQTAYRNLYQDLDDHGAFEAVTKWNARVPGPSRFPDLLRQAFRAASSGVPRPVHLALVGRTGNSGDSPAEGITRAEPRYGVSPSDRPMAAPSSVAAAVELLAGARRPVILAGNGVPRSGAARELAALAEQLRIPVVMTLNGLATIGFDHPLYGGVVGEYGADFANAILLRADVVLVMGSSLGSMTTKNWSLIPADAQIIQVDIDGAEIGRNFECAVPVVGDVGAVIGQLAAAASRQGPAEWAAEIADIRAGYQGAVRESETSDAVPIRPERLFSMVSDEMAADAVMVGDTGHTAFWTARHIRLSARQSVVRAAGSLGWGLPASLGVKCACPDREVVCVTGDAGFFYHLSELETARRYGINVIVVVNNNTSMNQETYLWDEGSADQRKNWQFHDTALTEIARGFGCHGARVDKPADFAVAMDKARASGLPAVIDVRTDIAVVAPRSFGPAR
ncbi:thiamine pyrophosphate-binding protein [Trebonia sp.]|uniref:thiamine pyrophosphate-binding protein n=1 Tax=Trebonia sp. TaxID=2767075 RepID=UPI00260BCCF5|nr:thiamine pyrophosphate-binding protein [Trebonia sp.]